MTTLRLKANGMISGEIWVLGSRFWDREPRTTIDTIVVKGSPHLTAVFLA